VAPAVVELMPRPIGCYAEPFLGGGAVLLQVLQTPGALAPNATVLASDCNLELVNAWRTVKHSAASLAEQLRWFDEEAVGRGYSKFFYDLRAKPFSASETLFSAARTLWLNRNCFNGLYRVNKKGLFNAPIGDASVPRPWSRDNLLAVSELLGERQVAFSTYDFRQAFINVAEVEGDGAKVVYADPPYLPRSESSFVANSKKGFGPDEHEELAAQARRCRGSITTLLSNADTEFARRLYEQNGARVVWSREAACVVGASKRRKMSDLLVRFGEGAS